MASACFKLSAVLFGHSMDVRAVTITHNNLIVSASRDKTVKVWKSNEINQCWSELITLKGHSHFVSSVCVLPPSQRYPQGLIITGGNDKVICIFTVDNPAPLNTLEGHTDTVCNLSPGIEPDTILSSSWDKTAKLWNIFTNSVESNFQGHEAAVWSVIQLSNGNVVTGGADKNIIIWNRNGTAIKTLKGHTDCVRGLVAVNDAIFLSASNDASIKQWTIQGECLNTYYGHSNYIYSICLDKSSEDGSFFTSGEDSTVRYWQGGENTQTINLPAQSVWCVACLNNGDVVTGTNDGVVRVFTQDPSRIADENLLKAYENDINNAVQSSNQTIGGVKVSDLPGREVLYEPGRSDGQTKLVRDGATVQCYSWSAAEGKWNKVGDVMGAVGGTQETSGKTLYEGKEYDFVFSVDIEDGKPPLKLPYNRGQDPWFVAQEFIHKNNLSQMFLDQVANFIVKNSGGGQTISMANNDTGYVDPFTGASRYVPGSTVGSSNSVANANTSNLTGDPFTGSSSYTTQALKTPSSQNYIPQRSYLRFDQANLSAIYNKLKEFNSKIGDGQHKVDDASLEGVVKLAGEGYHDAISANVLVKLLNWPNDIIFPVLDIVRLAIRHAQINEFLCTNENGNHLVKILQSFTKSDCTMASNQMLAFRILTNMFCNRRGEELAIKHKQQFLANIITLGPNLNKNVQTAFTTVLLNYCIAFHKFNDLVGLEAIADIVLAQISYLTEPEAQFRLLVATGTLVHDANAAIKSHVKVKLNSSFEFKSKLDDLCNLNDAAQLKLISCAKEVDNLLKD